MLEESSAAGGVQVDRYTRDALLALAHAHGYTFLNENVLKMFRKRGLFPPPRSIVSPPGDTRRFGVWSQKDAAHLLDICYLHGRNVRRTSLALSLWLHGRDVWAVKNDDRSTTSIRDLLVNQLERIQSLFMGKPLHTSDALSEHEMDCLYDQLHTVVGKLSYPTLADIAYGRDPARVTGIYSADDLHDDDTGEYLTPDETAGIEVATITSSRLVDLAQIGQTVYGEPLYRIALEYPDTKTSSRIKRYAYRCMAESLLVARIGLVTCTGWTLPTLIDALAQATDQDLDTARSRVLMAVDGELEDASYVSPSHVRDGRVDVRKLVKRFGSIRRLVADPSLFPLTALLIASHLDRGTSAARDLGLTMLAVEGLLSAEHDTQAQREGLARLLCAFTPVSGDECSALDDPETRSAVFARMATHGRQLT
jgi:hypothetical protein